MSTTTRWQAGGLVLYLVLLIGGISVVLSVLWIGGAKLPSVVHSSAVPSATSIHKPDVLIHVLLTLATVIAVGALFARICRHIAQPPVIGEILAGLALGPSLLGAWRPDLMNLLVPSVDQDPGQVVAGALKVIAQLGVILYMFLVGLELNAAQLKNKMHAAVAISHASIVVPFVLGVVLALWLYRLVSTPEVPFASFALFLGVAMSITAFPVLARILTDRNLQNTPMGVVALSCAAADDLTAWCLLSVVVGVVQMDVGNSLAVVMGAMLYLAAMLLICRPLLIRYSAKIDRKSPHVPAHAIAGVYLAILLSSTMTEWVGIHAIFGAFLLGVIIPSGGTLAAHFLQRLKEPVTVLLLPAFFAYTGMRTEIGLLDTATEWMLCLVIVATATAGKFGGTYIAARYAGESPRNATTLGVLMNTRGLMELIVLNIGLDLGVISPTLFAMMVIMAIVTTVMTAPALHWLQRGIPEPRASSL